jgi:AcrR family transcriptional regulator
MTQNTGNLRMRRMQKLLREALLDLIEERGFDELTVSEIIERAMVSRTAFYRHYQDKYDLVEQIFEEALSALQNAVGELGPGMQHPPSVWVLFFEHIAEYQRLYRALLGKKGSPWFVRKMRASLVHLINGHAHEPGPSRQPEADPSVFPCSDDLVPDLVSAMFVEAITWWLEHGKPSTPKEIATRTSLLASAVFREAST